MCYYTLVESKKERLELAFKAEFYPGVDYEPKGGVTNGFDHQRLPIIMNDNPEHIALVRWGLIPTWATIEQAKKIQNQTLNARAETLIEKPAFRDSQNRRCLVLVDGFYEWQHEGKSKIKHLIKLKDEENFALGGIWSYWKNPLKNNSYVRSFAILTVEANEMMAKIHNTKKRMPLIISKQNYSEWLNPEAKDLSYLIKPFDDKLMEARVVF